MRELRTFPLVTQTVPTNRKTQKTVVMLQRFGIQRGRKLWIPQLQHSESWSTCVLSRGGKIRRRRSTTPQAQFMNRAGKIQQAVEGHHFRVIRPIIQKIQKTVELPLTPFDDDAVDLPVVIQDRPVVVQTAQKSVGIPQFRVLDKVVCEHGVCPHGPGSARVEQVEQAPPSQIVPDHTKDPKDC